MATNIALFVTDASIVNHGGVPFSETENLTNLAGLRLINDAGTPMSFHVKENSRWDGVVSDTSKKVRHALLTFHPIAAGKYWLTDTAGGTATPSTVSGVDGVNIILTNSRGTAVLPKTGFFLYDSLTIDGQSVLNAMKGTVKAGIGGTDYMLKITSGAIIEQDSGHVVTRQIGNLDDGAGVNPKPNLSFEVWSYWYPNTPCIRTQIRVINAQPAPPPTPLGNSPEQVNPTQPVDFDYLRVEIGTMNLTAGINSSVLTLVDAINAVKAVKVGTEVVRTKATATFGIHDLTIIEAAEKFPYQIEASGTTVKYHIFPTAMQFHKNFVASWSFTLGKDTASHSRMLTDAQFYVDPVYAMASNVYTPKGSARFNWQASDAQGSATVAEVMNRTEQHLGVSYNISDAYVSQPESVGSGVLRMSVYEQAESPVDAAGSQSDYGAYYGWDVYGNEKQPAGGYTFGVYGIQRHYWEQFYRTGSQRAYRLASAATRYHADQGSVPSWICYSGNCTLGQLGNNYYEQTPVVGQPGSTDPQLTHSWGEDFYIIGNSGYPVARLTSQQHRDNAYAVNYVWNSGTNLATSLDGSFDYGVMAARGWPTNEMIWAWKWTGETRYLDRAVQYMETSRQAELSQGGNGYYIRNVLMATPRISPFINAGYMSRGYFETLMELRRRGTPNADLEAFVVRNADWIKNGFNGFPVLAGGVTTPTDRTPYAAVYFWDGLQDWVPTDGQSIYLAIQLNAMVNAAYVLTNRADLKALRDDMWMDLAFYLWATGSPEPLTWPLAFRGDITMRDRVAYGTTNKVRGQIAAHIAYHVGTYVRDASQPTPVNNAIAPVSGVVGAAVTLTISGIDFVQGCVVDFGGYLVTPSVVSGTSITVAIPAHLVMTGTIPVKVVNPNGETSGVQNYNQVALNPLPALTTIAPNMAAAGGSTLNPVVLTGTGFIPASQVFWNSTLLTSNYISPTQVNVEVPAALLATAGAFNVTVVNPTPGGGTSNVVPFTVTVAPNPAPTTTSISPSSVVAGGVGPLITIIGTGFVPTSVATFNGGNRTTTYVNSTQIQVQLTAADIISVGTGLIAVTSPTPGGGTSNSQTLTITAPSNPTPAIISMNPNTAVAGSTGFLLMISGTGFIPTSTVQLNGITVPSTYISPTMLQVNVPMAAVQVPGTLFVRVVNGLPGGGVSNSVPLTVNTASPKKRGVGFGSEVSFDSQPLVYTCEEGHHNLDVRDTLANFIAQREIRINNIMLDFEQVIDGRELKTPWPEPFACNTDTALDDTVIWGTYTGARRDAD